MDLSTELPSTSMEHIFSDAEFEDDKFHAASFVAKHRRVTSLDSLRDQLRTYCGALKQQLYSIINRDYKDFITIATKVLSKHLSFFFEFYPVFSTSFLLYCHCLVGWCGYACRTSSKAPCGFTTRFGKSP